VCRQLVDAPGEAWKRKPVEGVCELVKTFLAHVKAGYQTNEKVGNARALADVIAKSLVGVENRAGEAEVCDDKMLIWEHLERLLDDNVDINVISDYDHDRGERVYIANPDADEVVRVQRREIAAQELLLARAKEENKPTAI
jgi:hypothetical protein